MSSFIFGLIILLTGIIGIIVTLTFAVIAIFKRNSKSWKRTGYSLLLSGAMVVSLILVHEEILFPPNPKIEKLVLSAYREAPLGGIWLGVYNDQTWELGYSSVDITSRGTYKLSNDTLTLIATEGTTVIGESELTSFLIKPKHLLEVENTGIKSLEIQLNNLE